MDSLEGQLSLLLSFYRKFDPSKAQASVCTEILDKRRGVKPAVPPAEFATMCLTLHKKYGAEPTGLGTAKLQQVVEHISSKEEVPATLGDQLECLNKFYLRFDPAKAGDGCAAILDRRRGSAPAMSREDFADMCERLEAKYGEHPYLRQDSSASQAPIVHSEPPCNGVPATLDGQFQVLHRFYLRVDSAKAGDSCKAILHKRRGGSPAMTPDDFVALCSKLQEKYGQDPLAMDRTPAAASPPKASTPTAESAPKASRQPPARGEAPAAARSAASSSQDIRPPVPTTYDAQHQILDSFYAKHDSSKVGTGTKDILDARRGSAAQMELADFAALCCKLADKYNTSPVEAPLPATTEAQLVALDRFYAKHDGSKVGTGSEQILKTRRGNAPVLSRESFLELAWKLQAKYGDSVLAS